MSPRLSRARASLRYAVAVIAFGAALLLRYALQGWLGPNVPYLQFFPAILIAAWYGGFGPGCLATALSPLASMYFYLPPDGFAVDGARETILSLTLFVATGLAIAWLNHRLRQAEHAHRSEADLAISRAERLAAVINTTVDGIIVINARGIVEEFNRGAERLFGYPASEVIGRNVSMLMPSPEHEEHDGYLERYLTTGRSEDHRHRPRGHRPAARRQHVSAASVGRRDAHRRRAQVHRHAARSHQAGAARQRLRASEARWRAVIDSAVDGIIVIDAHGRIESFNPAPNGCSATPKTRSSDGTSTC